MYDANIEVLWCYFYKDQFDDLRDMVTFPGELYICHTCAKKIKSPIKRKFANSKLQVYPTNYQISQFLEKVYFFQNGSN